MFNVEFTKEEQEKIAAAREARKKRAEERNTAAQEAYKKVLAEAGHDETRLIVYPMPSEIGGATIHWVPTKEAWALLSKRVTSALLSDGKKQDYAAAIAGLIEHPALLVHPSLSELQQQWCKDLPGLYNEIHNAFDARCEHGQSMGK